MASQNPTYAQDVEMHAYPVQHPTVPLPSPDFLNRVQNIRVQLRTLTSEIQRLATLHQRALSSATPDAVQRETDSVHASAQLSTRSIRESIQSLKDDTENTPDTGAANSLFQQKRAHVETLAREFQGLVRKFLDGEREYKARRRDAILRQYRVVNPDADEAELREVVEGGGNVFQNALRDGRTSQATSALGAARARQNELQQLERSITELTRLFQDLETLVILDEPKVREIDRQVEQVDYDISKANKQVQVAQRSALRSRKMKWICLGIIVAIIIIVVSVILIWLKITGQI